MSGGSYRFLCTKDVTDFLNGGYTEELGWMLSRLRGIDHPGAQRAADATERVMRERRGVLDNLERQVHELFDVWHAVEWRDSNDWSEARMMAALAQYAAQPTPAVPALAPAPAASSTPTAILDQNTLLNAISITEHELSIGLLYGYPESAGVLARMRATLAPLLPTRVG